MMVFHLNTFNCQKLILDGSLKHLLRFSEIRYTKVLHGIRLFPNMKAIIIKKRGLFPVVKRSIPTHCSDYLRFSTD